MSTTFTWKLTNIYCDFSDGFVNSADYRVDADDETSRASARGSVDFERPDTLVPFDDLTEEIVIGWVKENLRWHMD